MNRESQFAIYCGVEVWVIERLGQLAIVKAGQFFEPQIVEIADLT